MKRYFFYLICFVCSLKAAAQVDTTQKVDLSRRNSPTQQNKPYLILISVDGFRYDYAQKYKANTLLQLSKEGVAAKAMIPSFPSLTFPNHYTIVTGLYPSHHGIVHNQFYDRQRKDTYAVGNRVKVEDGSWYGGTPLWVLAEQQQMLSACFYWVGSEAAIQGMRPTYYYLYNEKIDMKQRIQAVVNWLELPADRRPHLITFYLPEVDHAGHVFGPDSEMTAKAVAVIDSAIYQMTEAVEKTGLKNVNYILVSDHGMTKIDTENTLKIPTAIDTAKFIIPSKGGVVINLYANNKADILPTFQKIKKDPTHYQVYTKTNIPGKLRYGVQDDKMKRIGDIILIAKHPYVFNFSNRKPSMGQHGYDPKEAKDMLATFYAWGPAFKKNTTIPSFENVQVYSLAAKLLGLTYTHKTDGTNLLSNQVLAK